MMDRTIQLISMNTGYFDYSAYRFNIGARLRVTGDLLIVLSTIGSWFWKGFLVNLVFFL